MPHMHPVTSSNLVAVGYESSAMELYIQFHNGLYVYFGVPRSVYADLMSAPSHGHYHAAYIKNRYRYRRIG